MTSSGKVFRGLVIVVFSFAYTRDAALGGGDIGDTGYFFGFVFLQCWGLAMEELRWGKSSFGIRSLSSIGGGLSLMKKGTKDKASPLFVLCLRCVVNLPFSLACLSGGSFCQC